MKLHNANHAFRPLVLAAAIVFGASCPAVAATPSLAMPGETPILPALAMPAVVAAQAEAPSVAAAAGQPSSSSSNGPFNDDLFAGTEKFAKNAAHATEVNMTPDDLDDVRGPHASRAHATLLNTVHSYEFDKPGQYSLSDVDEFRRKLDGPGWHCSVHTRDLKTGGSTDVCSKHRSDDLKESAIITVEPKELTFIHRIERISPRDHDSHDDSN